MQNENNKLKIISLNIWGGAINPGLINFIKNNDDIEVFCFQEVFKNAKDQSVLIESDSGLSNFDIFNDIKNVLPNYAGYFRPHLFEHYGLAIFIKKDILVLEEGEEFVHKTKGYVPEGDTMGFHGRNIQFIKIKILENIINIVNFHGLWNGLGKSDTPDRLIQSQNIISFIEKLKEPIIVLGDFNLSPNTESLKKFENFGLKNLIKEHGITSTRTSLYTKPEKFADYAFVSPNVNVESFEVLPDEVSDHAAMKLIVNI